MRFQARRITDELVQAERHVFVGADRDQRLELRRGDRRRNLGVARLWIADRLRVVEAVFIDGAEFDRRLQRLRNVVLDEQAQRAVEHDAVAVEVGRLEHRCEVKQEGLRVAAALVELTVVELILQREGEGTIEVVDDREHSVRTRRCGERVADDGIAHRNVVRGQTGRIADSLVQAERHVFVGADRNQRLQLQRCDRRRNLGAAHFRIADRAQVVQTVFIDGAEWNRRLHCRRNVVLDDQIQRAGQHDAVTVEIGRLEGRRKVERQRLVVAGAAAERQMVELVQQREGEGAIEVVLDREHGVRTGLRRQRVAGNQIGHRNVVRGQALRSADSAVQAERHVLVGAGRD